MDGRVADAGDGGEDAAPVHLLLRLPTVCGTFGDELREIDLSCSDIALNGRNDCRRDQIEMYLMKCYTFRQHFKMVN